MKWIKDEKQLPNVLTAMQLSPSVAHTGKQVDACLNTLECQENGSDQKGVKVTGGDDSRESN